MIVVPDLAAEPSIPSGDYNMLLYSMNGKLYTKDDANVTLCVSDPLIITPSIVAKTADYSLVSADIASKYIFTNTGASGTVNFTLPATATKGLFVTFLVKATQTMNILNGGNTIYGSGGTSITTITSNVIGRTCRLISLDGTNWSLDNTNFTVS